MLKDILDKLGGINQTRDKLIPKLIKELNYTTILEIGTDVGDFAKHILNGYDKIERYFVIDPYIDNFGSDPTKYDKSGEARYLKCNENLQEHIQKLKCYKCKSSEALKIYKDGEVDFIWIDGDHSLAGVYTDLRWWKYLKIGGIMAFHDLKDGANSGMTGLDGKQIDYGVLPVYKYFWQKYALEHYEAGKLLKYGIIYKDKK